MLDVRLLDSPFDPADFLQDFADAHVGLGGLSSFTGLVRGEADVGALELTHYAPLTLKGMQELGTTAVARFGLLGLLIVHRYGVMQPGEPIVLVAAAAHHRRGAIDAVDYAMDHLKSRSWFWKREQRSDGWHWIEPRAADHDDLARWG